MIQNLTQPMFRYGVIEDTNDPMKLGRYRVRVVQVHTDNVGDLPTEDLPWAQVINPVDSAAMSGIGRSAPRLLKGTWCIVSFMDTMYQKPVIWGTIVGIPGADTNLSPTDVSPIVEITGNVPPKVAPSATVSMQNGGAVIVEPPYIGSMSKSQVDKLKAAIIKLDSSADIDKTLRSDYTNLANAGVITADVIPEKTAGLLCAAHFKGFTAAIDYVKGTDTTDAAGSNTSDYYRVGYIAITGVTTFEQPSRENLTSKAVDIKSSENQNALKYDIGVTVGTPRQGFKDPDGKYPLKGQLNESDLNRLARGSKLSQTIVGEKEGSRIKNIPVANSSSTWSQSPIPYNAVYPHNAVTATESGHVMEFDDTPGAERINIHHKAGTFYEVDNLGNATNRTKGIRTVIVEKDELVYIKGSGHVCIDGDHSLLVKKALEIQVTGDANIKVAGDCNQEIAGAWNVTANSINISSKTTAKLASIGNMDIGSSGVFSVYGSGLLNNTIGNLGPAIGLSLPLSPDNKTVPSYNTTIQIPAPVTRQEVVEFTLEDSPDITDQMYQDAPTPTQQAIDTRAPLNVIPVSGICGFTDLSMSTQLTTNYKLSDLVGTHPFPFRTGQHNLSAEEIACNLKQLAINVIEPLREKYAAQGFTINSCFREAGSNISRARGISQHELGQAIDVGFSKLKGKPTSRQDYYNLAREIRDLIPFDQLLLEYRNGGPTGGSVWLHISYKSGPLRRQLLTMNNDHIYTQGLALLAPV